MALTPPTPTDWTGLGAIWGLFLTLSAVCFKWINAWFAHKRLLLEQKKQSEIEYIQRLVTSTVTSTMEGCLKGIQSDVSRIGNDINTLFKYRDDDRKHYDARMDKIIEGGKR